MPSLKLSSGVVSLQKFYSDFVNFCGAQMILNTPLVRANPAHSHTQSTVARALESTLVPSEEQVAASAPSANTLFLFSCFKILE